MGGSHAWGGRGRKLIELSLEQKRCGFLSCTCYSLPVSPLWASVSSTVREQLQRAAIEIHPHTQRDSIVSYGKRIKKKYHRYLPEGETGK